MTVIGNDMTYFCKDCRPEKKQAKYGRQGEKPAHCSKHKLATMINVTSPRCEHDECGEFAYYGVKGGKRTHCRKHKLATMINVANKRCKHDECKEFANYGVQRYRPTHCREHKLLEMINVAGKRCKHDGCLARPSFGFVRGKGTHCSEHQLPRMADVMNQRCTECKTTATREKDKMCAPCRQYLGMGASRKLIRIEHRIIAMLLLHGTIPNDDRTKLNKSIGATCGGYRPDIYIDCGTFILIIEIDEHQHRPRYISRVVDGVVASAQVGSYSPHCETVRMLTIVQAEQMPVYFIRYNPDTCTIDGKVIKVSPEKRCEALRILIDSVIADGTPKALMTITYMYYDGALLRTETPALPAGF